MFFRSPYADALIVVLVLLLFFGPKRLPALGKSLGQGMREFKDSISSKSKSSEEGEHPELEAATPAPAAAPQQPAVQQPAPAAPQPAQPVPSAPQPPQSTQPAQSTPQPPQPGTQPSQPVPSAPQPPPAAEPAQPATVSAPSEQTSDQGSDSRG
jgi:sec-independent protein translocase protein TatA